MKNGLELRIFLHKRLLFSFSCGPKILDQYPPESDIGSNLFSNYVIRNPTDKNPGLSKFSGDPLTSNPKFEIKNNLVTSIRCTLIVFGIQNRARMLPLTM